MNIRPLQDRIVVRRTEEEETTAGGIVIPDNAKEKPVRGEVVAVGRGKTLDNGDTRALELNVGDKILFGKYSGNDVKVNNEELLVMREDDVLAVLEG